MSIYSGFATRKMEQNYNSLIRQLITLLQQQILQFMALFQSDKLSQTQKNNLNDKKFNKYLFILTKMKQYEEHKYLQPKFSQFCHPLKYFIESLCLQNQNQGDLKLKTSTTTPKSFMNHENLSSINKKDHIRDLKSPNQLMKKCQTQQTFMKTQKSFNTSQSKRKKSKKKLSQFGNSPYRKSTSVYTKTQTQYIQKGQYRPSNIMQSTMINFSSPLSKSSLQKNRYRIHRSYSKDKDQQSQYLQNSLNIIRRSNMTSKATDSRYQTPSHSVNITYLDEEEISKLGNNQVSSFQNQQQSYEGFKQFQKSCQIVLTPSNFKFGKYKKKVLNKAKIRKNSPMQYQNNENIFNKQLQNIQK